MSYNQYNVFFGNLANPLKIKIGLSLKKKKKSVGELVEDLGVEQSKVSHALSSLRCCNIVNVEQDGKKRIYSLNKETIVPMLKILDKHSREICRKKGCRGCRR